MQLKKNDLEVLSFAYAQYPQAFLPLHISKRGKSPISPLWRASYKLQDNGFLGRFLVQPAPVFGGRAYYFFLTDWGLSLAREVFFSDPANQPQGYNATLWS